jgi:hypothetical protein
MFFTSTAGGGKEEEQQEEKGWRNAQPHPIPAVSQCN